MSMQIDKSYKRYGTETEKAEDRYDAAVAKVKRHADLFRRLVDHVSSCGYHTVRDPNGPDYVCCLYCTGSEFLTPAGRAAAIKRVIHQPDCLYKEVLDWKEQNGNPV